MKESAESHYTNPFQLPLAHRHFRRPIEQCLFEAKISDVEVEPNFAMPHHPGLQIAAFAGQRRLRTRLLNKVIFLSQLYQALVSLLSAFQLSLPLEVQAPRREIGCTQHQANLEEAAAHIA
jgi:hypothetical protein